MAMKKEAAGEGGEPSEFDRVDAEIRRMQERLEWLKHQRAYLRLNDFLDRHFPDVVRFRFEALSEDDRRDYGYNHYVVMEIHHEVGPPDKDGKRAIAIVKSEDKEDGWMASEDARFADLREHIVDHLGDLRRFRYEWIECEDKQALALQIMGERGFALYEAEQLSLQAKSAGVSKKGVPRM